MSFTVEAHKLPAPPLTLSSTSSAPKIVAFTKHGASTDSKLLTTAVFGIVKLVSSMIAAVFLIDLLGRKKSVMTGVSLQMICSIYLGIFIKLKVIDNPITAANETASDVHYSQSALAAVMLSGVAWAIGINSVQVSCRDHTRNAGLL